MEPLGATKQQEVTLTLNRAGGFVAEAVFDLDKEIAVVCVRSTLMSTVNGGESWGDQNGQLWVASPSLFSAVDASFAPSELITIWSVGTGPDFGSLDTVGQWAAAFAASGRYLKVTTAINQHGVANPYNGPNNPTASVQVVAHYV